MKRICLLFAVCILLSAGCGKKQVGEEAVSERKEKAEETVPKPEETQEIKQEETIAAISEEAGLEDVEEQGEENFFPMKSARKMGRIILCSPVLRKITERRLCLLVIVQELVKIILLPGVTIRWGTRIRGKF